MNLISKSRSNLQNNTSEPENSAEEDLKYEEQFKLSSDSDKEDKNT